VRALKFTQQGAATEIEKQALAPVIGGNWCSIDFKSSAPVHDLATARTDERTSVKNELVWSEFKETSYHTYFESHFRSLSERMQNLAREQTLFYPVAPDAEGRDVDMRCVLCHVEVSHFCLLLFM
jgi:hypothetical protein